MNSYNHYSYGAIGDWMYRVMVGLDTYENEPGYKHILIRPHVGGGFSYASASLHTYYGLLSNSWKIENNQLQMEVEIPVNTIASIFIPAKTISAITENGTSLDAIKDIKVIGLENGFVHLEIGSGNYQFTARQ